MVYVEACGLRIARPLYDFINDEVIPGNRVACSAFWQGGYVRLYYPQ